MTYKYSKGKTFKGDIYNEDDTERNTYIDWSEDAVGIVTGGELAFAVSGSTGELSSSYNLSASAFYGDGSALENVTATASPAGSDGQIQYNNGGSTGGGAEFYWDDSNNRVGIGTDAPSHELTVAGDISGSGDLLLGGKISLGNKNVDPPSAMLHISSSYTQANPLVQIESGDDGSNGAQLLIKGNMRPSSQETATLIELNSNIDARARGIHLTTGDGNEEWFAGVPYVGARYQIGFDGTNGLPWTVNSASLSIRENGDVGIGTSGNPSAKLHVMDTGEILRLGYDTSNYTAFNISSDGSVTLISNQSSGDLKLYPANALELGTQYTDNVYVGRTDTTSDTIVYGGTSGAEVMRVDGSANSLGIGTSTPASTLDVDGSVAAAITTINGTSTTVGATHHTILMGSDNNNCTVTLPAAGGCTGRIYVFKRVASSATVKVAVQSGEYIDGDVDAELTFDTQYDIKTVQSNGTQWWITNEVHMGG